MPEAIIGKPLPRKEARAKVTGQARYVDDLTLPGMLHGATVRSTVPRGKIRAIHFAKDIPWDEFTVVTAKDIPGKNWVYLILEDQPCLADGEIRHAEEPVVLLAHPDPSMLERGRRGVTIEVEPLPAVLSIEQSEKCDPVIWGKDNVFKKYQVEKGDLDAAFASADLVVEGEYRTGAQEQLYIENQGMIAHLEPDGTVVINGSLQCPYYVHKALMPIFALPPDKVRVVQAETGGGFGGKEEYPSMIAAHAALLARKSGRPVKIIYDRGEDMAATTKRHPSRTRHRWALKNDGTILAMDVDFALDGGAYATLSAVVLSRGTIHAAGPYDVGAVRIKSRALATNTPPHGAFRGFGAPQSVFALERHMDLCAKRLGLEPDELRRRNFIKPGQQLATSQVVKDPVDMDALLKRALEASDYHAKRARYREANKHSAVKRGVGIACFMHGSGFTGSGEEFLASVAGCEGTAEGRVSVLAASTEIGQGANTVFSQVAAEALGIDYELVEVAQPDTAHVPNSGPTVASRTSMIVGKLVETAALALREALYQSGLLRPGYTSNQFGAALAEYVRTVGPLKTSAKYHPPPGIKWDDEHYRGDAYGAFAWAVYVADVSVDTVTYQTRVEDFVALQDVGRVINPVLAEGQIEGGVVQAIGFAIYENVVWKDGRMANNRMTDYIVPTSADVPRVRVLFEELRYEYGPGGAKGLGELPMDGPAPAIVNAIEDALGVSIPVVPVTPEMVMDALDAAAQGAE